MKKVFFLVLIGGLLIIPVFLTNFENVEAFDITYTGDGQYDFYAGERIELDNGLIIEPIAFYSGDTEQHSFWNIKFDVYDEDLNFLGTVPDEPSTKTHVGQGFQSYSAGQRTFYARYNSHSQTDSLTFKSQGDIDLDLNYLNTSPESIVFSPGANVSLKSTFTYSGLSDFYDSFKVKWYIDDQLVNTYNLDYRSNPLLSGESRNITYDDWTDVPQGRYQIKVVIDAEDVVNETDENNNELAYTVQVGEDGSITNLSHTVAGHTADISWQTDDEYNCSIVFKGQSDIVDDTIYVGADISIIYTAAETSASVDLDDLVLPNRESDDIFYYRVICRDRIDNAKMAESDVREIVLSGAFITNLSHTVIERKADISWQTDSPYNCSVVFKRTEDIVDDTIYVGAGIAIVVDKATSASDIDLDHLNLPNSDDDDMFYYRVVCRDPQDNKLMVKSDVKKINLADQGDEDQEDGEPKTSQEIKLLERIKHLEYKISELERKIVEAEKRLAQAIDRQLTQRLKGRILLQVEENGEAWYVDDDTEKKFYLKDGQSAYIALNAFGLGISNDDIAKIPIGIESRAEIADTDQDGLDDKLEEALGTDINNSDSDNDGYSDGDEVKNGFSPLGSGVIVANQQLADQLKGKILLQVQSRGEAWYVNPVDGKRYYMKDGDQAYQIMRFLSLGITNDDLRKIEVGEFE